MGDGEGERDGQELMERRSEAWEAVSEGGWMNTAGAIPVSLRASPMCINAWHPVWEQRIKMDKNCPCAGVRWNGRITHQVSTGENSNESSPRQRESRTVLLLRSLP